MKNGFTLLEMIVALGVFIVAITISLSALFGLTSAQRKAAATQNAHDNLRFALESVSKEIRTGMYFYCGIAPSFPDTRDCPAGESSFSFRNARGEDVIYRLANGQLEKSSDGGSTFFALTSSDITIENIRFYVVGSAPGDGLQPRVTIVLGASSGERTRERAVINLQTTVSQRKLDS